ncbi:MarC family protein [Novosphingobium profundi]|uniref:MarC family protein n=1 Tax=Novosphingobium profundi TaxID=1774954 RepID=UPI001BD9D00C|nr:MarC family protein [Novosphingobium profundi]MBT0667892.1 MarC family protein [Novosphingobium profundi]
MIELFISAFTAFFVVIDPLGCAPIYAGLSAGASRAQAISMAARACVISAGILLVFALFGKQLLGALHIELDAFRIAGGIMLFVIAIEMVFEKRTQRREERAEKIKAQHAETPEAVVDDVSVFPMAMPMIAGPGSIATIMLLMSRAQGTEQTLGILGAMLLVLVLTFLALAAAGPLMRVLGENVEAVITRLLGVLLAALATQYVLDGIKSALLS